MINEKKLAVIDMGTNTFHLLIVQRSNCKLGFKVIHRDRHYVLLAEDGINTISDNAINRARNAVDSFQSELKKYADITIEVVGTEALRVASNGYIINSYVSEQLGVLPSIISGDREAELIFKGNKLIIGTQFSPYLIMDIGGGSTEFILADDNEVIFSKSYPLGVTKLFNTFNDTDPISDSTITNLELYIEEQLTDLSQVLADYTLRGLIGASGSFEVLATVLTGKIPNQSMVNISLIDFNSLSEQVILSSIEERRNIDGIPESRVKLVQVAFVMMRKVIDMYKPKCIGVSPFAIKEGLISEWMNDSVSQS